MVAFNIAGLLAAMGDTCASYSYWTFGDVFEEQGVPPRPFHGGFGMIANGLIAKPTLWTFAFFNGLKGDAVYRDEHTVITMMPDGSYEGVAWNLCREEREQLTLDISLPLPARAVLTTETVDELVCNPLKCWHEMGEPASLTKRQLRFLRQAGQPLCQTELIENADSITLTLRENAVVRFNISASPEDSDFAYDYEWYRQHS